MPTESDLRTTQHASATSASPAATTTSATTATSASSALRGRARRTLAVQALRSIADAVLCTDARGAITWVNPSAERLLGASLSALVGTPLARVLTLRDERTGALLEDPATRVERAGRAVDLPPGVVLVRRDGTTVPIGDSAAPLRDARGRFIGVVIVIRDESAQRRIGHRLAFEAAHDALTGLPNRRAFEVELSRLRETVPHAGTTHAVLLLDLDRFKRVNDRGGHQAGDALLRAIGEACTPVLRPGDLLARLGGDEFGVLLPHCPVRTARTMAASLRAAVRGLTYSGNGQSYAAGVSIGIGVFGDAAAVADAVVAADRACYAAKAAGRGRIRIARAGMEAHGRGWAGVAPSAVSAAPTQTVAP